MFIEAGQSYLTVLPMKDGNHGYWRHIALITARVSYVLAYFIAKYISSVIL